MSKLAVRVEGIGLGRGCKAGLVDLWHGLEPLKVVLRIGSPILEVRVVLGWDRHLI